MTNEQLYILMSEQLRNLTEIYKTLDNDLRFGNLEKYNKRGKWIGKGDEPPIALFSKDTDWEWLEDENGDFICLDDFRDYLSNLQKEMSKLDVYETTMKINKAQRRK